MRSQVTTILAAVLIAVAFSISAQVIDITDCSRTTDGKISITWDSTTGTEYDILYSDSPEEWTVDEKDWTLLEYVEASSSSTTWEKLFSQLPDVRMFRIRERYVQRFDLNVCFIKRLPEIDYVWGSADPSTEGWPTVGQTVTWRAYVKSWAYYTVHDVPYAWYIDGVKVESGYRDLIGRDDNDRDGTYTYFDLPWDWTFDRHEIKFRIDHTDSIGERIRPNSSLMVYSDAISVGFYVEESVYDYFKLNQKHLGLSVGANSWYDWAQRHVKRWNQMFEDAVFGSDTPNGVLDRIRCDHIHIVGDGALPLNGGLPTNRPDALDYTIDLQWGFPATLLNGTMYDDTTSVSDTNPFYFEGSLMHELGHARYLIDAYGFNVHEPPADPGSTVAIQENSEYIGGTAYMPFIAWDALHYTDQDGLMSGGYTYVGRYDAMCMNLIAGHRAWKGNYNSPQNIGVFMEDLPTNNWLTAKNTSGVLLTFADVDVYQATYKSGVWYGKFYDATPDLILSTDGTGKVSLGTCPFDNDGTIEHTYGIANGVLIIRVEHDGKVGYQFLESNKFNMEYWRGNTANGNYELQFNMIN